MAGTGRKVVLLPYDASAPALWRALACLRANWLPCLLVPHSKLDTVRDMARWLRTADGCDMPAVCVQAWPPLPGAAGPVRALECALGERGMAMHIVTEAEVELPAPDVATAVAAIADWQDEQQHEVRARDRIFVCDEAPLWRWVWPCDASRVRADAGACLTEMEWACEDCAACEPHIEAWLDVYCNELGDREPADLVGRLASSSLTPEKQVGCKRQRCH